MDNLAAAQDEVLARLERVGRPGRVRAEAQPAENDGGMVQSEARARRSVSSKNEKPKGETVDYDELIKSWSAQ